MHYECLILERGVIGRRRDESSGEGFAANIGGRMLGTGFAFVTTTLTNYVPGASPPMRLALAAALVGTFVYAAGFICSFFLPEPQGEDLPE